jgi:putative membrane protein
MNRQWLALAAVGFVLVFWRPIQGQQQTTRPGTQSDTRRSPTADPSRDTSPLTTPSFVKKVAEDSQMEMELARIAAMRASSAQVKAYAQQIVRDHTTLMSILQKYASKHNVTFPRGPGDTTASAGSRTNSNSVNRSNTQPGPNSSTPGALASADTSPARELTSKTGADFDQAYVRMMVVDHEKAIALFEKQKAAKDADSEIRGFINNTIPLLRAHLDRAEALEKTMGTATDPNRGRNPVNNR